MRAIFRREIIALFATSVGYLVIGLFLVLTGLFLWVFKGSFNIFDYGFADLGNFFLLAPWVFLFVIPALTMKSFAEEKKLGTLELLLIKPLSLWQTVFGKFFGTLAMALLALLPTLLYVITIYRLETDLGNLDLGVVLGSYMGLFFLLASYTAIGLFASVHTDNQIVSFIISMALCFGLYHGFDALATLFPTGELNLVVKRIGMKVHFDGFARGILDSRDLIYLGSITVFFLVLTAARLKNGTRS